MKTSFADKVVWLEGSRREVVRAYTRFLREGAESVVTPQTDPTNEDRETVAGIIIPDGPKMGRIVYLLMRQVARELDPLVDIYLDVRNAREDGHGAKPGKPLGKRWQVVRFKGHNAHHPTLVALANRLPLNKPPRLYYGRRWEEHVLAITLTDTGVIPWTS